MQKTHEFTVTVDCREPVTRDEAKEWLLKIINRGWRPPAGERVDIRSVEDAEKADA